MRYNDTGNSRPWIVGIVALAIVVPLAATALNSSIQSTPGGGRSGYGGYSGEAHSAQRGGAPGAQSAPATASGGSARLPENVLKQETSGIRQGGTAPAFILTSATSSKKISSRNLYGKATLIDFFSTTCTVCIEQAPTLASFWHAHRTTLNVLGIDEGNSARAVQSFAHRFRIGYSLALDPGATVAIRYEIVALPTDILISLSGKVVTLHVGAISQDALLRWLHSAG